MRLSHSGYPNVWLTSDLHIGHVAMVPHPHKECHAEGCSDCQDGVKPGWRPFETLEEMHDVIRDNWNATVGDEDLVIVGGDVVMGKRQDNLPFLGTLKGRKVLILGNHDYPHPHHKQSMVDKWWPLYRMYFEMMTAEAWIDVDRGDPVNLSHFPFEGDHTEEVRYLEYRPADWGQRLLHGHLHSRTPLSPTRPHQYDMGVDANGYCPVHLEEALAALRNQVFS